MKKILRLYENFYIIIILICLFSGMIGFFLRSINLDFVLVLVNVILYLSTLILLLHCNSFPFKREYLSVFFALVIIYFCYFISIFYTISYKYELKLMYLTYTYGFIFIAYVIMYFSFNFYSLFKYWFYAIFFYNIVLFFLLSSVEFNEYYFSKAFYYRYLPDYLISALFSYSACFFSLFYRTRRIIFATLFIILMQIYLGARAPLICFVLISTFVYFKQRKCHFNVKISRLFIFGSLLISLAFSSISNNIVNRFSVFFSDFSMRERLSQYLISFRSIGKHYILGQGVNSSGFILKGIDTSFDYPHNIFLELWMEVGLVPFILFSFLFIFFLLKLVHGKRSTFQLIILCNIIFFFLNGMKSQSIVELRYLFFFIGLYIFYYPKNENSFC